MALEIFLTREFFFRSYYFTGFVEEQRRKKEVNVKYKYTLSENVK